MKALSLIVGKLWPRLKFLSDAYVDSRAMTLALTLSWFANNGSSGQTRNHNGGETCYIV